MSEPSEITMSVGSSLTTCATSGGSYVVIAGVKSYKLKKKRGTSDASALSDTIVRKKPKGRLDLGTLSVEIVYGTTEYAILDALMNAGTQQYFKLNLADTHVCGPLYGSISDQELTVPEDDLLTATIEIELTVDASNVGGTTYT